MEKNTGSSGRFRDPQENGGYPHAVYGKVYHRFGGIAADGMGGERSGGETANDYCAKATMHT